MTKFFRNTSLFIITLMLIFGFSKNIEAATNDCFTKYGLTDSNECRVTENRTIVVSGNGNTYRPLNYATDTRRTSVGTYNRYYQNHPTNFYRDIGINYYVNGSLVRNGVFTGYRDSNFSDIVMFCLDAQHEGYNPLWASRFLLDTNSSNGRKAFDVAIMDILINDDGSLPTVPTESTITDYWARLVAIRAVEYTFGYYYVGDSSEHLGAFHSGLSLINTWLNEDSSRYDSLNAALKAVGGELNSRDSFRINTSSYFSGEATSLAKEYYMNALDAAIEYLHNVNENPIDVDPDSILPVPTEVEVEEREEGDFVSKDVVHTIKVSGLANNGQNSFVINGLKFVDNEVYTGLNAYISSIQIGNEEPISGRENVLQILNQDLLSGNYSYDFTEETEIKITVHFEGYETVNDGYSIEALKCGQAPIKYYIDGTSTSSEFGKYSDYVAVIWYNNQAESQRYLSIEKAGDNSNESRWVSDYETYLIDACDCDDLIEACIASGDYYSEECDELREADCGECAELEIMCHYGVTSSEHPDPCAEYGAVCEVECPTTVDNFNCCDASNNLVVSPLDNWPVNIKGPTGDKIYACFVSQIDGQVQLQGTGIGAETVSGAVDDVDNSYTLDQNRYCVVSCKEDYLMTMPTAKLVNAGRYFTFKASIDGTKTCYTNTIDRDLYEEDILAAQQRLVEALNAYKYWEAASNTKIEIQRGYCGYCSGGSYYDQYAYVDTKADYYNFRDVGNGVGNITLSSQDVYETSDISNHCTGSQCCYSSKDCGGCCYSAYTGHTSYDVEGNLAGIIEQKFGSAKGELIKAQENYFNIIKEYNKCSEWTTELQYDKENPHVYYDYEESYLDDLANGYGDMTEVISNKNTSEWYCNSNVSSSGSENQAQLSSSGNNGIDYSKCSLGTSSSQKYTTINYVYCDTDGCGRNKAESAQDVSDARYKKITSSVSANYVPSTLFYNIYPSGEITNTSADDNVAIENGLPVSLSTKRGIYKYTVNIDSLGEYYDTGSAFDGIDNGDSGRLIASDKDDNSVINKDEYGDFVDENGTVQYACSYLVNMGITDEDTIVCDFDTLCTGDDCIADCIGPNCDYTCNGENCIADCIGAGCIYDSDAGTSLIERVVSLSNLFPNGTNSYNWNRDMNDKAAATIDEIEDAGNAIYNEEPILSVTITPSVARAIKQYNDDAEAYGGYSNSTLSCYALDGYEEIACYSSFITGLLEGYVEYDGVNYINNIDVINDRSLIMGNNYRTIRDNNTEYFTTWSAGISEDDMIGPSWK